MERCPWPPRLVAGDAGRALAHARADDVSGQGADAGQAVWKGASPRLPVGMQWLPCDGGRRGAGLEEGPAGASVGSDPRSPLPPSRSAPGDPEDSATWGPGEEPMKESVGSQHQERPSSNCANSALQAF